MRPSSSKRQSPSSPSSSSPSSPSSSKKKNARTGRRRSLVEAEEEARKALELQLQLEQEAEPEETEEEKIEREVRESRLVQSLVELPPPSNSVDQLPFPSQARCPKHQFEPLLWYCASCKDSICTICRIENHEGHETMSFEAITAPTSRRLAQLEKEVEQRMETLDHIDVPRLVDRLCSMVDSDAQFLDSRMSRRCEEIKQDVINRADRMRSEIEEEMEICKEYLTKVEDTIDVLSCVNVGEEPSQHPLFVPLMSGQISCTHFLRAAAPVDKYAAPRIVDNLRLLELPINDTLEACKNFDWTILSKSNVPNIYPSTNEM